MLGAFPGIELRHRSMVAHDARPDFAGYFFITLRTVLMLSVEVAVMGADTKGRRDRDVGEFEV